MALKKNTADNVITLLRRREAGLTITQSMKDAMQRVIDEEIPKPKSSAGRLDQLGRIADVIQLKVMELQPPWTKDFDEAQENEAKTVLAEIDSDETEVVLAPEPEKQTQEQEQIVRAMT